MTEALVGLGSNMGDRLGTLRDALTALAADPATAGVRASRLYQTAPVGGPEQGPFLNAVAAVQTTRDGFAVLELLLEIEQRFQRRREVRWGPRTLDLDLLAFGGEILDTPHLKVPHPRMHERRFVLVPLCDVAASWTHPVLGTTAAVLLRRLPVEPGDLDLFMDKWEHTG